MAPKQQITTQLDPDILKALDSVVNAEPESSRSIVIARYVREGLERAGKWPPKKKSGA